MAYVLRHLINDGILVDLGERLSGVGPFDSREAAEQRLSELERGKNNGKFSIEELVLSFRPACWPREALILRGSSACGR
jgi:hypothetical protein